MRLSVHYRLPLDEVLDWPAEHVRLIGAFLQKEPFAEVRVERLLAHIAHDLFNANYKPKRKMADYLVVDPWPKPKGTSRYSEADQRMMAGLMRRKKNP